MWKTLWHLLWQTYNEWWEDKVSRLSAALTYYTLFSLAPMLIIVVAVAGMFFGEKAAQNELQEQIQQLVGPQGAEAVQVMLTHARYYGSGVVATIIAFALLIYGATNVFSELQDAMDTIWEVQPRPGLGIIELIRNRFLSFAMVLAFAFLLLVSLVISTVLTVVSRFLASEAAWLWQLLNQGASLALFVLLFSMIFKFLPDVRIRWRDVWPGALLTAVLFTIGKALIGWYLGRGTVASVYGAAGSLVVLLVWVYYSSQILFIGAEFTQVYTRWRGERVVPTEIAVPMTEAQRQHQGIPHQDTLHAEARRHPRPPEPAASAGEKLPRRKLAARIAAVAAAAVFAHWWRKRRRHRLA